MPGLSPFAAVGQRLTGTTAASGCGTDSFAAAHTALGALRRCGSFVMTNTSLPLLPQYGRGVNVRCFTEEHDPGAVASCLQAACTAHMQAGLAPAQHTRVRPLLTTLIQPVHHVAFLAAPFLL